MLKEGLIAGGAGVAGGYLSSMYGAKLEAWAVGMSIPPAVAHAVVFGGFVMGTFMLVRRFV